MVADLGDANEQAAQRAAVFFTEYEAELTSNGLVAVTDFLAVLKGIQDDAEIKRVLHAVIGVALLMTSNSEWTALSEAEALRNRLEGDIRETFAIMARRHKIAVDKAGGLQ